MYTYTTIREIVDKLNLEILNEGNFDLKIDIPNIYQIGYELVGFLDKESDELNKYINVCSLKESRFLATFSKERKEKVISEYMALNFPALIFSKDAIIAEEFYYYAKKYNKKVIAVPRLSKYNEHVNDHQLELIEAFSLDNYILGCKEVEELEENIKKISKFKHKVYKSNQDNFIKLIKRLIEDE